MANYEGKYKARPGAKPAIYHLSIGGLTDND